MIKILANDGISPSGKLALENAGFEVITENVSQENLAEAINNKGYQALLVRSATTVRKALIDACPSIKLIGRGGVGMDNIDVQYARDKGLEVINTPAASSQSVAELVMAHLFSLCRNLHDANRQMPQKGNTEFKALKKNYAKGLELRGKILGIIGFGRIGQSVASYALGCGMDVMAHDAFMKDAVAVKLNVGGQEVTVNCSLSTMNEVLTKSDFVTLHIPAQSDGTPVIGKSELEQMKKGSFLINAARGGVVDEQALINVLDAGHLAGAGLDVFDNEPQPNGALLAHPKISLTPHIGAATAEAQDRIGVELAEKIIGFF